MACGKQDIIQMKNPEDIARYIRCNLLVGQVLTPIFREYMQLNNIPPTAVYNTIFAKCCNNFRKKLSQKDMRIVQTLSSDGYNKFDITLMYKIARNINFKMIITELPTRGWGTEPLPNEETIGDDIERIRRSRDHLMHSPNHLVSDTEFVLFFDKLVDVTRRADKHNNKADSSKYEQQLQDLRFHPIDPENSKILLETLEENKNLKEVMQLKLFPVYMTEEVVQIMNDLQSGKIEMDGTVQLKLIVAGTEDPAGLKDRINSNLAAIRMQCKDCLIKLDKASEGSLILYLEVQKKIFQTDSLLHAEMDCFLEIVFKVIDFKHVISIFSYIVIKHDDRYEMYASTDDEDDPPVVRADEKLVLNITVKNTAFQTDESLRQNLDTFVEAIVKDMNGHQIQKGDDVTAILRLDESYQEDDRSLELDDHTFVSNLVKQTKDHQMDQPVQQCGNVEASQTNMNSQQVATRSVQKDDRSLEVDDQNFVSTLDKYTKDHQIETVQQHGNVEASEMNMHNQQVAVSKKSNQISGTVSLSSTTSSRSLYRYLCQKIVGSEDHVKLNRLINASKDYLYSHRQMPVFTSGSIGAGLDMKGSSVDMVCVISDIQLSENIQKVYHVSNRIHFLVDTNDVEPGFAYLRLVSPNIPSFDCMGQNINGQFFLSSAWFIKESFRFDLGPCIIHRNENTDLQICLQSKIWISTALEWITKKHYVWPSPEVKQRIIDHGVLCVPEVGTNGLLWRLSFSLWEKFLMYTFTHTQLLCFALLKILLKDVINQHKECKHLLRSYYIQTIMFWVSEESLASMWTPNNLIPCFMKCFNRIIYCVKYSVCPHYFIQEKNLFENRFSEIDRKKLLETLYFLMSKGWQCIYFSKQISESTLSTLVKFESRHLDVFACSIEQFIQSKEFQSPPFRTFIHYKKCVHRILCNQSKTIRSIFLYHLTKVCSNIETTYKISSSNQNKNHYKNYKRALCFHLQGTQHDAVSGWLMLASFFYQNKQYLRALYILSYSLTKCTTEKVIPGGQLSHLQRENIHLAPFRKSGILRFLKTVLLSNICFPETSYIVPEELKLIVAYNDSSLPPVVYLHFLRFLCHYHLHDVQQCRQALLNLKLTIERNFFILGDDFKSVSNKCYEVAEQIFLGR